MFIEFTTTITHRIDIGDEGIAGISHAVDIDAGEEAAALGTTALYKIAKAGCEATIRSIDNGAGKTVVVEHKPITDDEEDDDAQDQD